MDKDNNANYNIDRPRNDGTVNSSRDYVSVSGLSFPDDEIRDLLGFFPRGVVAFDLETTGLSPLTDKIIEIGGIKITPHGEVLRWQSLINPLIPIPKNTTEFHHIVDEMVSSSPIIQNALPHFIRFIDDLPLLAHNAKFDIGFVLFAIKVHGLTLPLSEVFDSCRLGRKAILNIDSYRLSTLAGHFGVNLGQHHRAICDAYVCLRIFSKCLNRMQQSTNHSKILDVARLYKLSPKQLLRIDLHLPEHLLSIVPQMARQELVEIKYDGGSYKGAFRPVRPISFLPTPAGIVLYAQCILSQSNKSFAIRKIIEIRTLGSDEIASWVAQEQQVVQEKKQQKFK
ncbi:MAG: 3'-5' exonuclease [Oligoflexia bacterium]|nr:3'-5' exonuclease [Oligoflexia bacterium]